MNLSQFKQTARQTTNRSGAVKPVLINCGAAALVSILVNLLGWLLAVAVPEGGIGNLGTHSILNTLQITLTVLVLFLLPLWDTGLCHSILLLYRGQEPAPNSLLEGFRRWGSVTGAALFRWLQYAIPILPCGYMCYSLYVAAGDAGQYYPEMPQEFINATYLSYGTIYALSLVPLLALMMYRYRMVPWLVMDDDAAGGLSALRLSTEKLKGHKRQLFRLDLSYWWFHLADKALLGLSLSGMLLDVFWHSPVYAQWLLPMAAAILRVLLHWVAKPEIMNVYCVFFQTLPQAEPKPKSQSKPPEKMPWKY